jgi:hypothetical protein
LSRRIGLRGRALESELNNFLYTLVFEAKKDDSSENSRNDHSLIIQSEEIHQIVLQMPDGCIEISVTKQPVRRFHHRGCHG